MVQQFDHECDALIVGGGLSGPALGLALAQSGLRVIVVDARAAPARAKPDFDGRAYALAIASVRLLSGLGVWQEVASKAQPITQIQASDGGGFSPLAGAPHSGKAPFALSFESAEIEEGPMGHILEDRYLYRALHAAMRASKGVRLLSGESALEQEVLGGWCHARLASGKRVRARLIIGCDGRQSQTAQRAGIRRQGWSYGQTALVTALRHTRPHEGIARQVFLPAGPLAVLPLAGEACSSIVWSESNKGAAAIQALDDEGYLEVLRPRLPEALGAVELAGARFTYPLSLSLAMRLVAPRLALVGDAAHGVHPLAGQGLNLGLRDVAAIAEVLEKAARRGEDIGALEVLERYERWRRFDTASLALAMDQVNALFMSQSPLVRLGRGLGLRAVGALPALRRGFIRQAAGLGGALPARLKEQRP